MRLTIELYNGKVFNVSWQWYMENFMYVAAIHTMKGA